jgi:predicted phosphoribosyltransferase
MEKSERSQQPKSRNGRGARLFADRADAGIQLAAQLGHLRVQNPVVIGLARGGMPVASEVARRLGADLDVLVVRKLGAPGQPELAIGALAADGTYYLNRELVLQLGVSDAAIERAAELQGREASRLEQMLRGGGQAIDPAGRTVILIDDGLATGATMRVAILATARHWPKRLIVAAPVAASETCRELAPLVDELVCPNQAESFRAVGDHYANFAPTADAEVLDILDKRYGRRAS